MLIADEALNFINSVFAPLPANSVLNSDCVRHNRTGEIYSISQIESVLDELYKERYIDKAGALHYAYVLEYVVDSFSALAPYYTSRLTATYRQLKCPHTAIFFFLYFFEEYGTDVLTPELLTSTSAAFKDLALKYEIGSPKNLRYERCYKIFLKCAEDLAETIQHDEYRLNLQYSYELHKAKKLSD